MGFIEQTYTLPLQYPLTTYQAYDKLLDIEIGGLTRPFSFMVYRILYKDDRIEIHSNTGKIYAVCTPQNIVFTCRMDISSRMGFGFFALMNTAVIMPIIATGIGVPVLLFAGILFDGLLWLILYIAWKATFKRIKQVVDAVYGYTQI